MTIAKLLALLLIIGLWTEVVLLQNHGRSGGRYTVMFWDEQPVRHIYLQAAVVIGTFWLVMLFLLARYL